MNSPLKSQVENQWLLIPYEVKRYEHMNSELQPGQPVSNSFTFNNPFAEQNVCFILTAKDGGVENISISIDNHRKTVLQVVIKPGQNLKYEGGDEASLYSENWQLIRTLKISNDAFRIGNGDHDFSVECRFPLNNKGTLKLEIKTSGNPEAVGADELNPD